MTAVSLNKWLNKQSGNSLKKTQKIVGVIIDYLELSGVSDHIIKIPMDKFKEQMVDFEEIVGVTNRMHPAVVPLNKKIKDDFIEQMASKGVTIPHDFNQYNLNQYDIERDFYVLKIDPLFSKYRNDVMDRFGFDYNEFAELMDKDLLFFQINDLLALKGIQKKIHKIISKINNPEIEAIVDTNNNSNISPILKEENGIGYLKFNKNDPNPGIKIGKVNTRKYRLLSYLIDFPGVTKATESVFNAIKDHKDKLDGKLNDSSLRDRRMIELLEFQMKELQKIDGLKGRIYLVFSNSKKKVCLKMSG